ncbi:hypothetical protein [Photobacterium carnosum]|uniref:hypothetical protein n=1 Tax=Photobacterium carnosum TaxID=2023717 RepID=UPI001E5B571F|nr:hypothetical protein [Photobacterium carnosum]MCD9515580.1 hypothetical protein [Photobacterium carnosum]
MMAFSFSQLFTRQSADSLDTDTPLDADNTATRQRNWVALTVIEAQYLQDKHAHDD